jgi:hypothetical protein
MGVRSIVVMAVLVLTPLVAVAADWQETDWGADVVVDAKTGRAAVVFHLTLQVEATDGGYEISASWNVFAVVDGAQVPFDGMSALSIRTGEVREIFVSSPRMPIEAGERYGATVVVRDSINDLTHRRTFDFLAPAAVPCGILLTGWDGSEPIDLSGLPDEELEELVLLHDLLDRCTRTASDVSVERFLRGDAATSAYPLSVLLLPTTDLDLSRLPMRIVVVPNLFVYTLSAFADAAGVLAQLMQFDQEFVGDVYSGAGSSILGGGKTIFVQDTVWNVLEASATGLGTR